MGPVKYIKIIETVNALADFTAVAIHYHKMQQLQRQMGREFVSALEAERKALAYDLHDGLTQYILASHLMLDVYTGKQQEIHGADLPSNLLRANELMSKAAMEARHLVTGLRLLALEHLGIVDALDNLIQEEKRYAGWETAEFEHDMGSYVPSDEISTAIYRIVQEALTNARKYANTPGIQVKLLVNRAHAASEGHLTLSITDWGLGFDTREVNMRHERLGLRSMSERTRLLNGSCQIKSSPGSGTSVIATIPI